MAKTKSVKSSFPPAEATVETRATSPAEEPFPDPVVCRVERGGPEDDTLTEEERQLNAIESKKREIIGTVESKLKGALSDACAHLKLLTKLGIEDILTREDFGDYREVLFIGREFAQSESVPAAAPRTASPRAPRQRSAMTVTDAILQALSDGSQMDIPSITAKVASLKGQVSNASVGQGLVRLKKEGKITSPERGMYSRA
jgi:hypothetical protein